MDKEIFCPNCGAELSMPKQMEPNHKLELQKRKNELCAELVQCVKAYEGLLTGIEEL